MPVDLSKFINHISLNLPNCTHIITNEKTKIDHYTDKEALDFHKEKKPRQD